MGGYGPVVELCGILCALLIISADFIVKVLHVNVRVWLKRKLNSMSLLYVGVILPL